MDSTLSVCETEDRERAAQRREGKRELYIRLICGADRRRRRETGVCISVCFYLYNVERSRGDQSVCWIKDEH